MSTKAERDVKALDKRVQACEAKLGLGKKEKPKNESKDK